MNASPGYPAIRPRQKRPTQRRIGENPFYILGLSTDASRVEIEREGNKLLGMLKLGLSAVKTYLTPIGRYPRTEELVREAMAELRDPERRLVHELWAQLVPDPPPNPTPNPTIDAAPNPTINAAPKPTAHAGKSTAESGAAAPPPASSETAHTPDRSSGHHGDRNAPHPSEHERDILAAFGWRPRKRQRRPLTRRTRRS